MSQPDTRRYRKRRRAEQEGETRRRITEATVALHGSLGPARTTVSAIAERAGVQRATVYRHFPDEESLFAACSAHWIEANPLPDLGAWAKLGDADARLGTALEQLYAWFEHTEQMLERTTRDAPLVPAMQPARAAMAAWFEAVTDALLQGRGLRGRRRATTRAAIGHALAFETWRNLVRAQQLSQATAIELMRALVAAAGRARR